MLVGTVAIIAGLIPVGYGLPWYAGMGIGLVVLYAVLVKFGTKVE